MEHTKTPAILRLECLPKPKRVYPKGSRVPLTKELAERFCDLIATCDQSTADLLAEHPEFPTFKTLETWRFRFPWFKNLWNIARQRQAEFLMQKCISEARNVTGKTAHAVRVKFDIYRFLASKFHPDVYGDKSQYQPSQTTVNVGVSISPERLSDLRLKLDHSRTAFLPKPSVKSHENDDSCVYNVVDTSNGKRDAHKPRTTGTSNKDSTP